MRSRTFGLIRFLAGVVFSWSISGCISVPIPKAEADATRYYVLSTDASVTKPVAEAPTVQLRPIEVANYLDARAFVVRRGQNEIEFREFARWGEPLELGIGRVLREELLAGGAARNVIVSGNRPGNASDAFQLTVRVLACEGSADGAVIFRAVWELTPTGNGAAAAVRGEYRAAELKWDAKTEASLAAQLSDAVSGLAKQISAALAGR